jgi:hypothetical protein
VLLLTLVSFVDQLDMLKEKLQQNKFDRLISENSKKRAMDKIVREVRENRQKELNLMRMRWESQVDARHFRCHNPEQMQRRLLKRIST